MSTSSAFTVSLADVLIIGILFLFALYGSKRGVRGTLNSIFRIYFSFIIAILFYEKLALLFQAMVDIPSGAARLICFTVLFAVFLSTIWTIGVVLRRRLSKTSDPDSSANRVGGAALGLLECVLLISIVIISVNFYPISEDTKSPMEKSISYKAIKYVAEGIESFTIAPLSRLKDVSNLSEPDESEYDESEFENP